MLTEAGGDGGWFGVALQPRGKAVQSDQAISTVDHLRRPFTPALSSGFSSREFPLLLCNIRPDWILIILVNLNSPFFLPLYSTLGLRPWSFS
jgi:hypothetical protein